MGATAFRVELDNVCVILFKARRGLLACSYFSVETADRLGDALALVSGVSSFDDVLDAGIIKVSIKARELGLKEGMSGRQALKILS